MQEHRQKMQELASMMRWLGGVHYFHVKRLARVFLQVTDNLLYF
jgi:hypothetical protein